MSVNNDLNGRNSGMIFRDKKNKKNVDNFCVNCNKKIDNKFIRCSSCKNQSDDNNLYFNGNSIRRDGYKCDNCGNGLVAIGRTKCKSCFLRDYYDNY